MGAVLAWVVTIVAFGGAILYAKSGRIGPAGAQSLEGLTKVGAAFGFVAGLSMGIGMTGGVNVTGLITALVVMALTAPVFRVLGRGL
jgi:hypothetical protein